MFMGLRLSIISLCFVFAVAHFSNDAHAGAVRSCGVPSSYDLNTHSPVGVCDIYTRQLMYRDEAIKLRQQILNRAVSFQKPRAALYAQYKENLQALHDNVNEGSIPSFFASGDE